MLDLTAGIPHPSPWHYHTITYHYQKPSGTSNVCEAAEKNCTLWISDVYFYVVADVEDSSKYFLCKQFASDSNEVLHVSCPRKGTYYKEGKCGNVVITTCYQTSTTSGTG